MNEDIMIASCNHTISQSQRDAILIVMASVGAVSFCMCLLATKIVWCLKLYKYFIYRLAMYQVLSSMLISIDDSLVITLSSYVLQQNEQFHHVMCLLTGFLLTYFIWIKLLFTTILAFHLFSLAVCLTDLKYLEVCYVLFAILVPLTFTWIPFIGGNYGPAGGWCWIKDRNEDCSRNKEGILEQYVLFYGPWYLCLVLGVISAIIVLFVLMWKGYCRRNQDSESNEITPLLKQNNAQHKKALIEVMPLLAYSAIFFFFNIFAITHRIYNALNEQPNFVLAMMHSFVNAAWGTLSSIALILHIIISRCIDQRIKFRSADQTLPVHTGSNQIGLYTSYTEVTTHAQTCYIVPTESEVDRDTEGM